MTKKEASDRRLQYNRLEYYMLYAAILIALILVIFFDKWKTDIHLFDIWLATYIPASLWLNVKVFYNFEKRMKLLYITVLCLWGIMFYPFRLALIQHQSFNTALWIVIAAAVLSVFLTGFILSKKLKE